MSLFLYVSVAESKCLPYFLSLYLNHFRLLYWHNCSPFKIAKAFNQQKNDTGWNENENRHQ